MKKPEVVNVFGQAYKIVYAPLEDDYGQTDEVNRVITIDSKLTNTYDIKHSLAHEFMHAVFDRLGYRQVLDDNTQELLCENIASFLVDNNYIRFE